VIGKPLKHFYMPKQDPSKPCDIMVPFIFIKVYEYFYRSEHCLKLPKNSGVDLFGKLEKSLLKEVDRLEQHFSLGDYAFIFTVKEPQIVAYYLKCVLKYMQEPLCTFALYPKFKKLCEIL
jgi:hypothetical protein